MTPEKLSLRGYEKGNAWVKTPSDVLVFRLKVLTLGPQTKLRLEIVAGARSGEVFELIPGQKVTLGRTGQSTIAFEDDNYMSSVHFEIEHLGDHAEVRDLRSTNKTWLNNQVITTSRLNSGDTIRAGKTRLSVYWVKASAPPPMDFDSRRASARNNPVATSAPVVVQSAPAPNAPQYPVNPLSSGPLSSGPSSAGPLQGSSFNGSPLSGLSSNFFPNVNPVAQPGSGFVDDDSPTPPPGPVPASPLPPIAKQKSTDPVPNAELEFAETFIDLKGTEYQSFISKLCKEYSIGVIAHFKRIGRETPHSLSSEPFFSFVADKKNLPVVVLGEVWGMRVESEVTNELVGSNALMIVLLERGTHPTTEIRRIEGVEVPGQSRSHGFLDWCWPRSFENIHRKLDRVGHEQFFGHQLHACVFLAEGESSRSKIVGKSRVVNHVSRSRVS